MRSWRHFRIVIVAAIVSGCATGPPVARLDAPSAGVAAVELADTPFFPQRTHQCGPAALATMLVASGVAVMPQELTAKIYLPERRGTLQAELIAASRRYDRVPYPLAPSLDAVLQELHGGNPVLVLQNLGNKLIPVWHYAVVIGYLPEDHSLVLRSGGERRSKMDIDRFLKTWRDGGNWALVILPPNRLPADPDPGRYLAAVAALESAGRIDAAIAAYATAMRRWPDSPAVWYGLGNAHFLRGSFDGADAAYRQSLALRPDNAAVRNNLAQSLLARHCLTAAADTVRAALALNGIAPETLAAITETGRAIEDQANSEGRESETCPVGFSDQR
jgi:tetratricopeptide (TPR) repeat protein